MSDIVPVQQQIMIRQAAIPSEHEILVYNAMSDHAVASQMYKGIGGKAGVMMIMLAARELGIPPMQALNKGINIINGTMELSARMMAALIRKAGHRFIPKVSTDKECVLVGTRCDTEESMSASFTIAEAQQAGLIKPGSNWIKFPKDMCYARALSRLARQLFSDVVGVGYVEGEISGMDPKPVVHEEEDAEVVPAVSLSEFTACFKEEDHLLAIQWLAVVKEYSQWTEEQAIERVMADKERMMERFEFWKKKTAGEG
jgi:hypothetical protein